MAPEDNPMNDVQPTKEEWEAFERRNMNPKHTPGPWIRRYTDRVTTADDTDGTKSVCHVYESHGKQEMNATLIASSPEMLDLLIEIQVRVQPCDLPSDIVSRIANVLRSNIIGN